MELKKPIAFIDLETTGTDINNDRIVEISICKVNLDFSREVKTRRVNPGILIPAGASEIHGIKDEDVANEPPFRSIAKGIHAFIDGCDIGGFNSNNFDIPLLFNEFERSGIQWDYTKCNFIDVGNIYKIKEPRTLAAAVKFYTGENIENAHSAEADINATVDVFFKQLEKYDDVPTTAEELHLYCNYGKRSIDLSGWFAYADDGVTVLFNKGKHKDKKVSENLDYIEWMLRTPFPSDVHKYCLEFINQL